MASEGLVWVWSMVYARAHAPHRVGRHTCSSSQPYPANYGDPNYVLSWKLDSYGLKTIIAVNNFELNISSLILFYFVKLNE